MIRRIKMMIFGGGIILSVLGGIGWYINSLHNDISDLTGQTTELRQNNTQLTEQLEANIVAIQEEAEQWRNSINQYAEDVRANEQWARNLQQSLDQAEGELQQCFQLDVPQHLLDHIFSYGRDEE